MSSPPRIYVYIGLLEDAKNYVFDAIKHADRGGADDLRQAKQYLDLLEVNVKETKRILEEMQAAVKVDKEEE